MNPNNRPMGMRAFIVIWLGQIVSMLGSAMTGFGVTIWLFGESGRATALTLGGFFFVTPLLLLSPVVGAMIDRYNRKLMMMVSDLASGATTIVMLLLYSAGHLQLWHVFVLNAISGAFQAFQWPAFSAAITMMLPKEQYGRAHGLLDLGGSGSRILAPVFAGALLGAIGLDGIMIIDVLTFAFAVGALLFVHIPEIESAKTAGKAQTSIWQESAYGWHYIRERPSLLGLQLVFLVGNFFAGLAFAVTAAMILARTGNDEKIFGATQSVGAVGGLVGGLAMAAWGGPKRRVHGVLVGWMISGLLGLTLMGLGQSLWVWGPAMFMGMFIIPILNGSNQALWQAKVAPEVQGRVFSIRRLIAWFVSPLSRLLAGPLVDFVLEPAMKEGGALAGIFGGLVGTGPGAGMALLIIFTGALAALTGLGGYAFRAVRDVEDILPDHDAAPAPEPVPEPGYAEPTLPWEPVLQARAWSRKRKASLALGVVIFSAAFVWLGWLQVRALTSPEVGQASLSAADVGLQPSEQIVIVVTPTSQPTVPPTATATPRPTSTPRPSATALPTASPTPEPFRSVVAGQVITYTLVVTNYGPSDATDVVVTDTLPAGVIFGSAAASQGSGCVILRRAQADMEGVFTCYLGDLANGASAIVTVTVTPLATTTVVISNTAAVAANQVDPNPADNQVGAETRVQAGADLAIRFSDLPGSVMAGEQLTYTLTVINNGPSFATGVWVSQTLPAGVSADSARSSQGEGCTIQTELSSIACNFGSLPTGASGVMIGVIRLQPSTRGQITHTASVAANEIDPRREDNVAVVFISVEAEADTTLVSYAAEPAVSGRPFTYTLVVTNNGPAMATGVSISDMLPPGAIFDAAMSHLAGAECQSMTGTVACLLGDLEGGESVRVGLAVVIDPATTGQILNQVDVWSVETDPNPFDNTSQVRTPVRAEANLSIGAGTPRPKPTSQPEADLGYAYLPAFEEADCAFEIPEGFQPECGYLIVPEDRNQPDGRQVRLHVAIFRSVSPNPAPDPVIHLAGGPGASALSAAQPILRNGGTEILKQRDYILFDQRGTQYSDPYLYCLPYDEYLWDAHELDLSLSEYNAGALPKLAACLDDWREQGINVAAYTSAESAADVNDLRLALGYTQVNLYGTSYGTRLALTVMRDHPQGIRSVIIDSVEPPQVNLGFDLAVNANRSLQEVFKACAADDFCSSIYGDIEAKFYAVIDRLEDAPVVVRTEGPYRAYSVYLDGNLFIDVVFGGLYSMASISDIPYFIDAVYRESFAEFSEPVGAAIGSPLSTALFWSTTCGEEVPFGVNAQRSSELANLPAPLVEHFSEQYALDVCALWDIPPADPKENEAVVSDIPTLIFSGRYDPITPPGWAELAAETLSNHYYYNFLNMAHGVMRSSPCALQMGLAFLDDPVRAPDSSCMDDTEGIEFH